MKLNIDEKPTRRVKSRSVAGSNETLSVKHLKSAEKLRAIYSARRKRQNGGSRHAEPVMTVWPDDIPSCTILAKRGRNRSMSTPIENSEMRQLTYMFNKENARREAICGGRMKAKLSMITTQ